MRFYALCFALLLAQPLFAEEEPLPVSTPLPQATPVPQNNLVSLGTQDLGWGLSYERFLDRGAALQVEVDGRNADWVTSTGLGLAFRFYPVGQTSPTFFGGIRARVFDQSTFGGGAPGYYRGLRVGPQAGIRLPTWKSLVLSYELSWSWDIALYQSDPKYLFGESWMSDGAYTGNSGRISDAVSVGWMF